MTISKPTDQERLICLLKKLKIKHSIRTEHTGYTQFTHVTTNTAEGITRFKFHNGLSTDRNVQDEILKMENEVKH